MSAAAVRVRDPWDLDNTIQTTRSAPVPARLYAAVRYAVLAPSTYNTQPWRFALAQDNIILYADRTRALPVIDPTGRVLTISCGAGLFHLRLALRGLGLREETILLPGGAGADEPLARVHVVGRAIPSPEDITLLDQVTRRHTNRLPFDDRPLTRTLQCHLRAAADEKGVWLWLAKSDAERAVIAVFVAEADRIQWADPAFRSELADWLRPNRCDAFDGIPGYAQGLGSLSTLAQPFVVRALNLGARVAAAHRRIAIESAALVLLGTAGDTPREWLQVGQTLARVLLWARAEEVWGSFLNQPVQVPALRTQMREVLGLDGYPQLLLRLGHGRPPRPTPRRPVEDVIVPARPRPFGATR